MKPDPKFEEWFEELKTLATEQNLAWALPCATDSHREAYENGHSPLDELTKLADMAQWRGCGCGGGGG